MPTGINTQQERRIRKAKCFTLSDAAFDRLLEIAEKQKEHLSRVVENAIFAYDPTVEMAKRKIRMSLPKF